MLPQCLHYNPYNLQRHSIIADPFELRYGKYCGIGYTGCAGEAACDGIDSCCLAHDHCIGSDLGKSSIPFISA
jgi:hypothetical protein